MSQRQAVEQYNQPVRIAERIHRQFDDIVLGLCLTLVGEPHLDVSIMPGGNVGDIALGRADLGIVKFHRAIVQDVAPRFIVLGTLLGLIGASGLTRSCTENRSPTARRGEDVHRVSLF